MLVATGNGLQLTTDGRLVPGPSNILAAGGLRVTTHGIVLEGPRFDSDPVFFPFGR